MSRWIVVVLALLLVIVAGGCSASAKAPSQVPASEIISRMAEGQPVYCEGATIVGDIDLCALPEARAKSVLSLINCTVADANFNGLTLEKDVIFLGTTFGNVSFTGTAFHQPAAFDGAKFLGFASFVDSQFDKDSSFNDVEFRDVDFNYSKFGGYSFFSAALFLGNASFSDVGFLGAADFSSAKFSREANFIRSRFDDGASFSGAFFGGPTKFGLSRFQGLCSFGDVTFAGEANFGLARFSDAAYFSGAQFQDRAIFGLTKFEEIASFQGASFADDLILKGALISTFLLENGNYGRNARIILNDSNIDRLKVHWREIKGHLLWDPGAYLALVNNYRNLGWSSDEDDCYYQYRRLNQEHKSLGWSKAIDALAHLSCGYGVRPSYAVAWSLLTILIFAMVFWLGDGIRRSAQPLQGPAETYALPEHVTFRNAIFFSTMIFLSQGPIDFLPVGRHRYYVILEGILGWLLLALFLVTLGKVMIR
ncbi:MAG: hypothetical protein A4E46_01018 [Methanosaeta sp. PtaU1.Bin016]|jgi:uncharacterized protein YjbI with pentapeptide repeats|nr:MAG: hypothetical protein A4E46_01018 [Methanosaeta sp. PtaU1.Bin016]